MAHNTNLPATGEKCEDYIELNSLIHWEFLSSYSSGGACRDTRTSASVDLLGTKRMASSLNKGHIRDIVAQVKSGAKSKTDAFNELKQILQTTTNKPKDATAESESSTAAPETDSSTNRYSQQDRRNLINKLIEKKRSGKVGSEALNTTRSSYDDSYGMNDEASVDKSQSYSRNGRSPHRGRSTTPRSRSLSQPSYERAESRINRIAQTEAAVREEMFRDFTFKPGIKELPASYGAPKDKDLPFHDRVMKWQREREVESIRRRELNENSELMDCTFKPRINKASQKAVKEIRGEESNDISANERLYRAQDILQSQRAKFIEDQLRVEKEMELQECTFQPQLATSKKKFDFVNSRFDKPSQSRMYIDESQKSGADQCTFTPKVRGVGRSMSAAKLYCKSNIVDRLTRPFTATPKTSDDPMQSFDNLSFGDRPIMNVSTFMNSLNNSNLETPGRRRSSSAPRERMNSSSLSVDGGERRQQNFKEFMNRQIHNAEKKSQHIKQLQKNLEPKFTPKLCKKSVMLSEQYVKGEFFDRLDKDLSRRNELDQKLSVSVDNNCTFTPGINPRSKKMKSRSYTELSKGDVTRRATHHRQIREKTEQETFEEMTFQPEITRYAKNNAKSKINLADDEHSFLVKYRRDQQKAEEKRLFEMSKRREDELRDCSFHPETTVCPSYIKRIAKSMAVVKAARAEHKSQRQNRPQWR